MADEEFFTKYSIQLNEQQTEAVRSVEGPVLLLAVPGSGKTTVLVTRLGYMIYCAGIVPENILTLTYTVAATKDMASRFNACFGEELGSRIKFQTINGVCAGIIYYYGQLIGKNAYTLVPDEKNLIRMLSEIYQETEGSYATESDLKGIKTMITYIKNMMLSDEEVEALDQEADWPISKIYKAYCGRLQSQGQMDYDDQLVYAHMILRKSPETLRYYQDKYPYICVDEAQDTSKIQHEIINLLAGQTGNLFMVGDEDQSIYGFRAAYPEALLNFEQNHPGAKILLMEENFRSNAKIVAAADQFIQRNMLRHEKHMRAARGAGADIKKIGLKNRAAQYQYLVKVAEGCKKQTAVLYRDNESILPLVDLLERQGIPYRIRNAELTFFTHRVVMDIRNIISFAVNPKDTGLFMQIYYKISTYINKRAAAEICAISEKKGMDVLEAAMQYDLLPDNTKSSCNAIKIHLKSLLSERADWAIDRIVRNMGYGAYLERSGIGNNKLFILKTIARNEFSPREFVERLDELKEKIKEKVNDPGCRFILSTIHASKGLEYDNVYLMDVADGIFPEAVPEKVTPAGENKPSREQEIYEEERRLFYVGVTRAKDRLYIFGTDRQSTFCKELLYREHAPMAMPHEAAEKPLKANALQTYAPAYHGYAESTAAIKKPGVKGQLYARAKKQASQEEFVKFCEGLRAGLVVEHKRFGQGVVVDVDGECAVIRFGEQEKKFGLRVLFDNGLLKF